MVRCRHGVELGLHALGLHALGLHALGVRANPENT
jgi:hypothetical protein